MTWPVFISYASEEEHIASQLTDILREHKVEYFLDKKSIEWGNSVKNVIGRGLQEASSLIAILSDNSIRSQWVTFEIGHAIALGTPVLPFLTKPTIDLPDFLRDLHFVRSIEEFRENVASGFKDGMPLGTRGQSGPFSGTYMGSAWSPDLPMFLLDRVYCRQIGERVRGHINNLGVFQWEEDNGSYRCVTQPNTQLTFNGSIRERLFMITYESPRAEENNRGVITLQGNTSGRLFRGQWAGLVENKVETGRCEWMRSDLDEDSMIVQVPKLIRRDGFEEEAGARAMLLRRAGLGKLVDVLKPHRSGS